MFPESGIGVITAGYSLSVALLIAVLAIHVIKWSFLRSRHFRKRRAIWIFHMCAVLIFSYIIMFCARLYIHFEPDKNSRESCIAAMATSQTIILTIFFWLLNKIRLKIYIARLNFKSPYRHSLSIAFGYGLPLLIVGVTLSVTLGVQDSKYVHGNDFTNCVISRKNNVIAWSFLLPSGLCLLYDLVGMIYVLLSLFDNWQKLGIVGKARLQRCFNSPSSVTTINDSILISVNTVMWLMALLYYYEEKGSSKTYADLFTIWHSLFGVALFFTSVLNSDKQLNPFRWMMAWRRQRKYEQDLKVKRTRRPTLRKSSVSPCPSDHAPYTIVSADKTWSSGQEIKEAFL